MMHGEYLTTKSRLKARESSFYYGSAKWSKRTFVCEAPVCACEYLKFSFTEAQNLLLLCVIEDYRIFFLIKTVSRSFVPVLCCSLPWRLIIVAASSI